MKAILSLLFVFFCGAVCGHAQQESLTIGPADLLHVKVLEAPELEQSSRVSDAGNLTLIIGGTVKVAGLTPPEAALAIEHALVEGNFMLTPHVSVTIEQPATQNVTIIGEVHAPGSYPIGTPRKVLDVLALAGGLSELADRHIVIQRHDTGKRIDFTYSNNAKDALDADVDVFPGDTILISKVDVVYMLGDVRRPGGFPMSTNDSKLSVLQAVSMAEGTAPNAVPNAARLIRKQPDGTYADIRLPLSDMQKGKKPDMALQADDIVYVPFSYLRNAALGISSLLAAASSAAIVQF